MDQLLGKLGDDITGVLSGWDRILLRGTYRGLCTVGGMMQYLSCASVLLRDFADHAQAMTAQLSDASYRAAQRLQRPMEYLTSSRINKEQQARRLLQQYPLQADTGLVCILSCVEPCLSYEVRRSRQSQKLELHAVPRKCLHHYHYFLHPTFGWLHARIQTWFPFSIQICLNGREWLAKTLDRRGLAYERYDNCFPWIEDFPRAQKLMNGMLRLNWPKLLDGIARAVNPAKERMFPTFRLAYYWSAHQSEWASDLAFRSPQALASIYPQMVWGAMTSFSSPDVMRFLGRRYNGAFGGQIVTDFKDRPEGIRLKHQANGNSVKLYDKGPNILRAEVTLNQPQDLRVYRATQNDPHGPKDWRPMRKGVADMRRRAEVCQKTNERYLNALSQLDTSTRLHELLAPVSRPCTVHGRRVRALRLWTPEDQALLQTINRPEFLAAGFKNADLAGCLYPRAHRTPVTRRRAAARISYRIRLLRAHGLIAKLPNTRRYRITPKGTTIATAAILSQHVTLQQLTRAAA